MSILILIIFCLKKDSHVVMKAKILNVMDEFLLSNPLFCRAGSKWQFSPVIQSQITGG